MTARPCGCPAAGVVAVDDELHGRWHQLVVEQGGPAGVVDIVTLRAARPELTGRVECDSTPAERRETFRWMRRRALVVMA